MTVRINKQKINLREKLTEFENKVNFDEVVRGLGEYTGNVGIGVEDPGHLLHIKSIGIGDFAIEGTQPRIWLKEVDQTDLDILMRNHAGQFRIDVTEDNGNLVSTPFLINNTDGNVGIGTTSPSTNLEVLTSASAYSETAGISTYGITINDPVQSSLNLYHGGSGSALSRIVSLRPSSSNSELAFITQSSAVGRTEKMRIDPNGNIGIGTTNPTYKLDVKDTDKACTLALRGYDTFGDGEVASQVFFLGTDNASTPRGLAKIKVKEHDATLGTGSMHFETRVNGVDSEKMVIDSDGDVGIGTTDPSAIVSLSTATNAFAYIKTSGYGVFTSNSTGPAVYINKTNATTSEVTDYINFRNRGVITGSIEHDGTDVKIVQASDARLKKNIQDSESGLNLVNNLKVRSFDWVGEKRKSKRFGFVAQEMHEVFEEAVKIGGEDENESPWGISDSKLIPVLTKAIQEQQSIIEDLKSRIETLESK